VCSHTLALRHLWLCALIALCEITTVTTAVWATPCFPGHLGHQLPITATALSLSDTTAHNEGSPGCGRCSDTTETLSPPSMGLFLSLTFPLYPDVLLNIRSYCCCMCVVCVCVCLPAVLLTDTRDVQGSQGHHRWVGIGAGECVSECVCLRVFLYVWGRVALSLWCVTFAAALSLTNGALVEPYKESPAEVLFESAWAQWGTAGSVWSTSADVGRMSTVSLIIDDHPLSTKTVGIYHNGLHIYARF